ncbi:MAG: ornithine carbamoyltransferase [Gammaproteobacteria bacterium]|nr:ornithine carbamoyltransferase [Gammaproteobacteria bacterium]
MKLQSKHLLTGGELDNKELIYLLELANELKTNRYSYSTVLHQKHLALMFDKHSLRTRISFTLAMRELGGDIVESQNNNRKQEEPEDQMRVLQGYCDAVMIRTHADETINRMQTVASVPLINGLSNFYHPCQALADLMTLQEKFHQLKGLKIAFVGDGNNVLHSLLLMAPKLGVEVHYSCPVNYGPDPEILQEAHKNVGRGSITSFNNPMSAVKNCHAVYTDVWTSMGFEERNIESFEGFQVDEVLMAHAEPEALFMHCMPMNRGQEVSLTLPDQPCSVIFQQSENRLHVQKALLYQLLY